MTSYIWQQQQDSYSPRATTQDLTKLPVGIYSLEENKVTNSLYLRRQSDYFSVPQKLYGQPREFVERVLKTWYQSEGNLGVLLSGVRGTGKTVTAKLICNNIQLPIITINKAYDGLITFLETCSNDNLVLFFDEFEKVYSYEDDEKDVLVILDGYVKREGRLLSLLTCNKVTHLNENFFSRPNRLRYHKKFEQLETDVIKKIVQNKLVNQAEAPGLLDLINTLQIVTMDLICSLIDEMNIHQLSAEQAFTDFNLEEKTDRFSVVMEILDNDGSGTIKTWFQSSVLTIKPPFNDRNKGDRVYVKDESIGKEYIGEILSVENSNCVTYKDKDNLYPVRLTIKPFYYNWLV